MTQNKEIQLQGTRLSLRSKMFILITGFSVVLLLFLWMFELAFMEPFYKQIRLGRIEKSAELIEKNIDHQDIAVLIKHIAYDEEFCIAVVDKEGYAVYSESVKENCSIHTVNAGTLAEYYQKAKDNEGTYTEDVTFTSFNDNYDSASFEGKAPANGTGEARSTIYARIIKTADGTSYAVLLDCSVTPAKSAVSTMLLQLLILTVMVMLLSLINSYVMSKIVAQPIMELNLAAKEIAKGTPAIDFEGGGYKEINELKDTLNYAANEIAEVEHYRRELIANVSHDLRTPLTLIRGYTEMMRDIPGEVTPENLQVVIDEASRLSNLVNDMLDLSKEQEGNEGLNLAAFDIVKMLEQLLTRHGKLVEHLGYTIEWEHEESANVYADETKLMQVIYNLINNAVNYAGEDKKVIVKEYTHEGNVRIEVTDNGEGIDVDVLPHIWDRYYKSEKSHRRATVGTGLGLSIVKTVMSKHPGGVYGVITSVGKGSTFYVELPKL